MTAPDSTHDFWTIALHKSYREGRSDGFDECVRTVVGPLRDEHEQALNDARKAGELAGQIKALEWVRREGDDWQPFTRDTIAAELDRLRAEKERLG